MPYEIKPFEFLHKAYQDDVIISGTNLGRYEIKKVLNKFMVSRDYRDLSYEDSIEEAKEFAEKDYQSRIKKHLIEL